MDPHPCVCNPSSRPMSDRAAVQISMQAHSQPSPNEAPCALRVCCFEQSRVFGVCAASSCRFGVALLEFRLAVIRQSCSNETPVFCCRGILSFSSSTLSAAFYCHLMCCCLLATYYRHLIYPRTGGSVQGFLHCIPKTKQHIASVSRNAFAKYEGIQ
eukprot:scaffold44730_cov20-Tisochrysis_lutea.AAC.4